MNWKRNKNLQLTKRDSFYRMQNNALQHNQIIQAKRNRTHNKLRYLQTNWTLKTMY